MKDDALVSEARYIAPGKIEVTLTNKPNSIISFFNRVSLVDAITKERVLPAFYDINYLSVLPGEQKKVIIEYPSIDHKNLAINIDGWNTATGAAGLLKIKN